jgi:hypothetical protein
MNQAGPENGHGRERGAVMGSMHKQLWIAVWMGFIAAGMRSEACLRIRTVPR